MNWQFFFLVARETAVMNGGEIGYKWIPPDPHSFMFGEGRGLSLWGWWMGGDYLLRRGEQRNEEGKPQPETGGALLPDLLGEQHTSRQQYQKQHRATDEKAPQC